MKETVDAEGWCTKAVVIEGGEMAKLIRPKSLEKNGYSQFCNEMYTICSRRQFLY